MILSFAFLSMIFQYYKFYASLEFGPPLEMIDEKRLKRLA